MKRPLAGGAGEATGLPVALPHPGLPRPTRLTGLLENERLLAVVLLAPAVVLLAVFIAYPFVMAIWYSLTNIAVGRPGQFVGLANFQKVWGDSIFHQAFRNTFFYTFWATIFKLSLGMWLALLLNRHFRFKRIVRASMLLPWIIPTVLSTLAWLWMFDATFSVFNWVLLNTGLISRRILWLGDGTLAIFQAQNPTEACRCALRAEENLRTRERELNARRIAEGVPTTNVYLGLHIGDVFYGNIGSTARLDFTVIGPAVNELTRIAGMSRSLDQDVVLSAPFAEAAGPSRDCLVSLGRYALRGVGRPQELFTLDRDGYGRAGAET